MDKLFQRIVINVVGHDRAVLKSYTTFVKNATINLGIQSTDPVRFPKIPYFRYIRCTNRAKFAKKKYKLHYETRTYREEMAVLNLTGSTASTFLEYVERNIPEGVGVQLSYEEICQLPPTINPGAGESKSLPASG